MSTCPSYPSLLNQYPNICFGVTTFSSAMSFTSPTTLLSSIGSTHTKPTLSASPAATIAYGSEPGNWGMWVTKKVPTNARMSFMTKVRLKVHVRRGLRKGGADVRSQSGSRMRSVVEKKYTLYKPFNGWRRQMNANILMLW